MILHVVPEIGRKIAEEIRAPIPDPEVVFKKITPTMRKSSRVAGEFVRLCRVTMFLKVLRRALLCTAIWIAVVGLWHVDRGKFPREVELRWDDFALKYAWQFGPEKLSGGGQKTLAENPASTTPGSQSAIEPCSADHPLCEVPVCKLIFYGGLATLVLMAYGASAMRTISEQLIPEGMALAASGRH